MKVQAAVCRKAGAPLEIEEVEVRKPLHGEVLVKLRASGICHTDLSVQNGSFPFFPLPIILGHEGAGEVVEVGEGVKSIAVGDHVVIMNMPECGKCRQCLSPSTNICQESGFTHLTSENPFPKHPSFVPFFSKPSTNEKKEMNAMLSGTFATHTLVHELSALKIPKDFPFEEAALIGCGVLTGIGCTQYATQVTPGSSVIVFGVGSIGLNCVQGAKMSGARVIIAVDLLASKEAIARQLGATHFINASELGDIPLLDRVVSILGDGLRFVDFAFEAAGNTKVLETAVGLVNPYWGVVIAVGVPNMMSETKLPASAFTIGRTIKGVYLGNSKSLSAGKQVLEWHAQKKIQIKPLITNRITLQEINKGFEWRKERQCGR